MRCLRSTATWWALGLTLAVTAAGAEAAGRLDPGPPHQTNLELGAPPPNGFNLLSTAGEGYDLLATASDRSLLLLFFRGTW